MSGKVWIKFYCTDWLGDPRLGLCSLAAQGLWMRCVCIMQEMQPAGYLAIDGRPMTTAQLMRVAGGVGEDELLGLLDELETAGVFSRDDEGRIYSRRILEEARQSDAGREAVTKRWGKKKDQPAIGASAETPAAEPAAADRSEDRDPIPQKPEARIQTAAAAAPPAPASETAGAAAAAALVDFGEERDRARKAVNTDEAVDLHRWICERAGAPAGYRDDLGVVRGWLDGGLSATEIRDGVAVVLARQNGQLPTSLRYFEGAILDQRKRRTRPASPAAKKAAGEGRVIDWRTADLEHWRKPLEIFGRMVREKGADQRAWPDWARWRPAMGPPPGEAGCWAPAQLVAEALASAGQRRAAGGRG